MSYRILSAAALVLVTFSTNSADALGRRSRDQCGCEETCTAPTGHYETQLQQRTVYVNETAYETRKIFVVEYRPQTREREIQVRRLTPFTEAINQEYTVLVPQICTREVTETVYKPVWKDVERNYTVMVPKQETRQATRNVVHFVPVEQTFMVTVNRGHWEDRAMNVSTCDACGNGCSGRRACNAYNDCTAQRTGSTWVSQPVQEERTVTHMERRVEQQQYQYTATVCVPETRTTSVRVCERVPEQVTREVQWTERVPETRTRTVNVTKCQYTTETKTVSETVMVPTQVEKEVSVPTCRTVPKQVQCEVRVWVPDQL